jgi:two-component system NtrC family sensor kinase
MPETRPNGHGQLRRQMFVALLAFGLVPLLAMGGAVLAAYQQAAESRTRSALEAMVKNRKVTVDLFLAQTLRQLELAATLPAAELSNPARLEALLAAMRSERGAIVDLGLIGANGRHLAYVGPYQLAANDYSGAPWFQEVMVKGRHQSDVFLGFRRFPHMVMAVKKREGGRDYVLRATIDSDFLSGLVREGGIESGADVFVLDRAGRYQTRYAENHRLMELAPLRPIPLHSGVLVRASDEVGGRELVASAWLKDDSWVLVARQPVPALAIPAWPGNPTVRWVLLAGLAAVPVLAYLVARRRMRQVRALEAERAALHETAAQAQKMAAVGRLAAGVAHEINNPLAIIQAQVGVLSDLLADPAPPPLPEVRERLARIAAQVERGRKVTHRLLFFSRRVGPELEPVDVVAALEEIVGLLEKEIEASRVRLVRELEPDLPLIRSSLAQIQQVFLSLINNALDAVSDGGLVRLRARRADRGVEVTVADDGPGIPPRDLPRVFEPFFSTKSDKDGHTGLGLAICQETMRGLGGRISVESGPEGGAAFIVWFPPEAEGSPGGPQCRP